STSRDHRGLVLVVMAIALTWFVTPAFARNHPISLKGHWHADISRSVAPYGVSPRSVALNILVDDGHYFESQETQVRRDRRITIETTKARVDGKFYQVLGSPNNISVAITSWRPGFVRMNFIALNGLRSVEICKLSSNFNTMICDERDTNRQGKITLSRSVYTRDLPTPR
ncbi:MAG: hypothetical protein ACREFB_18295, partial [Stellaceae bacterium]